MERGKRIELSASAWKAEVLPLYEPRMYSGVGDKDRTCIKRICNPRPNHSATHLRKSILKHTRDSNPISRIVPYNQSDWQCALICSASPGGNYRVSRYDAIIPITHSFHPLPDRDRSRIASGLWVQRLPPVVVILLLIVWVTLSEDTRNVLAESVGFEPTHRYSQ